MGLTSKTDLYRKLPSVDDLLRSPQLASLLSNEGQTAVTDATRAVLNRMREEIAGGRLDAGAIDLALSGLSGASSHARGRHLPAAAPTVCWFITGSPSCASPADRVEGATAGLPPPSVGGLT